MPTDRWLAIDMLSQRYKTRPSDFLVGDADKLGFDLAVMINALEFLKDKMKTSPEAPNQLKEAPPDPRDFFNRHGYRGWNTDKN